MRTTPPQVCPVREKAEHRTTTKRLRYQVTVTAGGERYPLLTRRGTVDRRVSESALILGRLRTPVNTQPLAAFRRLICPPRAERHARAPSGARRSKSKDNSNKNNSNDKDRSKS